MKRAAKLTVLFVLFFLDIHISAEAIYFPRGCWGKRIPCSVENETGRRLSLQLKGMAIHLDAKTVVKAMGPNEADLARGTLFAKHDDDFQWHTPFGDVFCHGCQLILQRSDNSLEVSSLRGTVSVQRKGDEEKYLLPVGFSVTLSTVTSDGQADLDVPQATPLRPIAKTWAKVYPGSVEDFKKDLKEYFDSWKFAVETASHMHQEEASRQIATVEAERDREARIKRAKEDANNKLRALFHEKNEP